MYGETTAVIPGMPARSAEAVRTAARTAGASGSTPSTTPTTESPAVLASLRTLRPVTDSIPVPPLLESMLSKTGPAQSTPPATAATHRMSTVNRCRKHQRPSRAMRVSDGVVGAAGMQTNIHGPRRRARRGPSPVRP